VYHRRKLVPDETPSQIRRTVVPIRIAEMSDAIAIMQVINAAFRQAESFFIDGDRVDLEKVQSNLRTGEFLVAEKEGVITGCVYVELQGDRSYLGLLAIDPAVQNSGLGSKLMTAAEDHCRNVGSRFMDIRMVNLRKELSDFYHHRGYEDAGTEPFAVGVTPLIPCHFIKMSKPLT
jgi:N-acetylglutamate synthase-like GNAT family acetyltransferase